MCPYYFLALQNGRNRTQKIRTKDLLRIVIVIAICFPRELLMKRVREFQIKMEFGILVFRERGTPDCQEKNLLRQAREPTKNRRY